MDLRDIVGPLVTALSAVLMLALAVMVGRGNIGLVNGLDSDRVADPHRLARRLSRLLAAIGVVLFAAAGGFAWSGSDTARSTIVTMLLALALIARVAWLLLTVARARRDYRPLPQRHERRGR